MTDSLVHPELAALARRVVQENRRIGRTFALAESCTGGLVSAAITEVPGCSEVFEASFVTYSNEIKQKVLKVSQDVLETFGAVSVATAWAMAQGALQSTHAHVAVAITGIAGPAGGSDNKPVGTVVFARAERGGEPDKVVADFKNFGDLGRAGVRLQAALCALELLLPEPDEP
ncbi:competence damage-inducible protein A [Sphingobium jiangsuense]|uniref:Nicotinamide-nucleotide amidase n=1 Tax=Sphingobium jiangsuense TaxID=870476 RepID=A0A7W6BMP0_9SPHN|nr:CinA family protein [Sphingobium jiangsuense]MBB3926422.1 nicotinamide-nucleotide amidase [Sphingobium jiangsuense]GLS99037.1 competence damage-inducible protein A [Sphingobium jiangsuense]